jgi:hypothetical protein
MLLFNGSTFKNGRLNKWHGTPFTWIYVVG